MRSGIKNLLFDPTKNSVARVNLNSASHERVKK